MNVRSLARFARQNNIKRIYYFHTDHFEPMSMDGSKFVSMDVINQFISESKKYPHSRHMTLFIRPNFGVGLKNNNLDKPDFINLEDDQVGFYKTKALKRVGSYISKITAQTKLEFQLHIHHENFTQTDEGKYSPGVRDYLINKSTMKMDEERFKLYTKMSIDFIRENSKQKLERWFFIHGKWGLNASDMGVCRLDGELQVLRRLGCRGDFTFPAGRRNCDPFIKRPFTCKTPRIWRSYDYLTSDSKPVGVNTNLITKNRFLIWNSKLTHPQSSLDFYSPTVLKNTSNTDEFLDNLVYNSPVIGDSLFIKTYAHSMSEEYLGEKKIVFPLSHPNVVAAFKKLIDLSSAVGLDFKCVTADEVFRIVRRLDKKES